MLGQLSSCTAAEWNGVVKYFFFSFFMILRVCKLFPPSFGVLLFIVSDFGENHFFFDTADIVQDAAFSSEQSNLYLKKRRHDLVCTLQRRSTEKHRQESVGHTVQLSNTQPLKGECAIFCAAPAISCSFSTTDRGILAFQQTGDNSPFPTEDKK